MIPGHPASPNAQGEGGKTKRIHTFKTCVFFLIVIGAKSFPGALPEAAPWAGIRERAAAPSGEGRSGRQSRGAPEPRALGVHWGGAPLPSSCGDRSLGRERKSMEAH